MLQFLARHPRAKVNYVHTFLGSDNPFNEGCHWKSLGCIVEDSLTKKKRSLRGKVEKIIKSIHPAEPEKAQIAVEGADHLYREIRVPNLLEDDRGKKGSLKPGAEVDVIVEADANATVEPHD